jgi:hypothetical protein
MLSNLLEPMGRRYMCGDRPHETVRDAWGVRLSKPDSSSFLHVFERVRCRSLYLVYILYPMYISPNYEYSIALVVSPLST